MAEEKLEFVEELTYLGVVFDSKLKWRRHLTNAVSKANKRLMIAKRIAGNTWGLSDEIRNNIYKAIYLPTLLYAAPVWVEAIGHRGKGNRLILERGQRLALIWCMRLYRTNSSTAF